MHKKNIKLIEEKYIKLIKLLDLKYKLDSINKSLSIGMVYIDKLSSIDSILKIRNSLEDKNKLLKNIIDYKSKYDNIIINKLIQKSYLK